MVCVACSRKLLLVPPACAHIGLVYVLPFYLLSEEDTVDNMNIDFYKFANR